MLLYLYHGVCRTLAHLMSEVYSKPRQMYKIMAYTGIFRNIQQDSILMIYSATLTGLCGGLFSCVFDEIIEVP